MSSIAQMVTFLSFSTKGNEVGFYSPNLPSAGLSWSPFIRMLSFVLMTEL